MQFLLFAVFVIGAVLFLLTQQNTLKVIKIENRLMSPGSIWLQLIPVLGLVWQYFVVSRVAGSIRNEIESRYDDSILGIPDAASAEKLGKRPTLIIGLTYCILISVATVINFVTQGDQTPMTSLLRGLLSLGGIICWIIYWVRLSIYKRRLMQAQVNPDLQVPGI